ncbi:purine-nucleoside phosphorylase [bacterium]|nr:purine-nucleoside phosphorylase [bacterium]
MSLFDQIQEAAAFIRTKVKSSPKVGVICGTGMGSLGDTPEGLVKIPYGTIPHFPVSTVESHPGNLCFGKLGGKDVVVMQGRFHRYEGYSMEKVTFPVRVMKALGVETLIIMNAVGSVNPLIPVGALVIVTDHINMMGDNPLVGPNDERLGVRFPDMSEPYNRALIARMEAIGVEKKIKTYKGVLVAVTGPNLETAAEYRMFQRIGADCVTMSTIPECIVAAHTGLKCVALSTVTDSCLPDNLKPAVLEEIIHVANSRETDRVGLVTGLIETL